MTDLYRVARSVLVFVFLALSATPVFAQYLYMDANGDGVWTTSDVMAPNGTAQVVDVWLDRTHNRNGSLAVCNTMDGDLAVWNSYAIHISVSNGTASFTNLVNHVPEFAITCIAPGEGFRSNTAGMSACYAGMSQMDVPRRMLFTVTVTGLSGAPSLLFVPQNGLDFNFTSFGTSCSGNDFDNTYKLGSDFLDSDGLGAAAACNGNCQPTLLPIANMTVSEGQTATQTIHASDPDGSPIQFQKLAGPFYMSVTTTDAAQGTGLITLTPGFSDATAGTTGSVRANDGTQNSNVESFTIVVQNIDRAPVANPGGPYSGVPGVPVAFDGSASADPDGDVLTYFWDFGDLTNANGVTASHTYAASGTYFVTLVVGDGIYIGVGRTTAVISGVFEARAFTTKANRQLRLSSGKPYWTIQIEPVGGSFDIGLVGPASIHMKSAGTGSVSEIAVVVGKTTLQGDADGNGVADIGATFAKSDLQALFSNLSGSNTVPVTLEGSLTTGGTFSAPASITVIAGGGNNVAVLPNPLRGSGMVSYSVSKPGRVKVALFDVSGRLVRRIEDRVVDGVGPYVSTIDGRRADGATLASGIYYVRVSTEDGVQTQRITVLK